MISYRAPGHPGIYLAREKRMVEEPDNKTDTKGLETLELWQKAIEFATDVCRHTLPLLPDDEKYALTRQLRRAVQAIPANIAEGYGRYHYLDNIRFCYIARGSLEETFSHVALGRNLGYIDQETFQQIMSDIQILRRMLNGYIAFLRRSKRGEKEPSTGQQIMEDNTRYDLEDYIE